MFRVLQSLFIFFAATVANGALSSSAHAQSTLDPAALTLYGGRYSPDCRNPGAPALLVVRDALILENGPRRVVGRNPQLMASYPGPNPPVGFRAALVSQLDSGSRFTFLLYQDQTGPFIGLDGDAAVRSAFARVLGWRFWKCPTPAEPGVRLPRSPPVAAVPLPQSPMPAAPASLGDGMPWTLIADKRFRAAYRKALGPLAKTAEWLMKLEGPADKNRIVRIEGIDYVFAESCKIHECGDNTVVFLYAADRNAVYGKLVQASGPQLFGAPPPAIAAELDRLWRSVFAQNP